MTKPDLTQTAQYQPPATQLLEKMCQGRRTDEIFDQTLPALGRQLQCDRVFVYLRSPQYYVGRVPFCWQRHEAIPRVYDPDWKAEPRSLPYEDPMFAAALQAQPSLFIEDVETASPEAVNRDFEAQTFGHRALIHAHLCIERKLWGILQACIFDQPRCWNQSDHRLIERTVGWFSPLAMEHVHCNLPAKWSTFAS